MSLSLYETSVPVFLQLLGSLSAILDKAAAQAEQRKIDPAVLLATRLYPDMFPLLRQVQLATDFTKGPAARLAGIEVPKFPDTETTVAELQQRIGRAVQFLKHLTPAQFDGAETRDITIPVAGQPKTFTSKSYLLHFALPNFYFHVTTAYAILRHCGIEVGKLNFLGSF
jgi:hypothetical protein